MRSLTLEKIRKYKARKNIRALIKALHYPKATLKTIAAEALGKIGDSRAVEPLIKTLKDKNVNVRISAAKALVKLYQSAYLDDRQKKMILTLRADIAGTHKPHEDKYYEPCVGVPHKDVPAIKVEFPL